MPSLTLPPTTTWPRLVCHRALAPLTHHHRIAAIPFIEALVFRQTPMMRALRLTCMLSACFGGLEEALFQSLQRDFLHAYGHGHLVTLKRLERLGLLHVRGPAKSTSTYAHHRDKLRLVRDHRDAASSRHAHYYGFAPLSVALIEHALQRDVIPAKVASRPVVVVAMLGGALSAELASLRTMAEQVGVTLHIAVTSMTSGPTLLDSLLFSRPV